MDTGQGQTPYTIKTFEYSDGVLDSHVDATYIIHLKGNGREQRIIDELNKVHPTNTIHIVYNEGFRKVDKGPRVKTTVDDLTHTYLWIFENAVANGYRNIMVLEDDYIFGEDIKTLETQQNICGILESRKEEDYIFLLGCLPFILIPRDQATYTGIAAGMHCAIYSEQCILSTLANRESIVDWDIFFTFVSKTTNKYVYPSPLCYQLYPETENSTNWGMEHSILAFLSIFAKLLIKMLFLDKQVEPGHSFLYVGSKLFGLFLVGVVVYVVAVYPLIQISNAFAK